MPSLQRWLFNGLLLLSVGLFVTGIFTPLMELEKFWFFHNRFSLVSALQVLLEQQETGIFMILFMFSIITPIVKIVSLALLVNTARAYQQQHRLWLSFIETWGKWSMLDVFVVALFVVALKLGPIMQAQLLPGLYIFTAAVLIMQLLSMWLHWWLRYSR